MERKMRMMAAAGVLAACFAATFVIAPGKILPPHATAAVHKQSAPPKKPGPAADTCRYAHDNECDEPDIGTGACALGTDYSDCRYLRTGEGDFCRWARDGQCDEPNFGTGACPQGSDR